MPKISKGGVSNTIVDPDYIAPPGVPPEVALDRGMPDAGQPAEEEGGDESSPGKTSSPESKKPDNSTKKPSSNDGTPSTARTTAGRSTGRQKDSSTAGSAGTS